MIIIIFWKRYFLAFDEFYETAIVQQEVFYSHDDGVLETLLCFSRKYSLCWTGKPMFVSASLDIFTSTLSPKTKSHFGVKI